MAKDIETQWVDDEDTDDEEQEVSDQESFASSDDQGSGSVPYVVGSRKAVKEYLKVRCSVIACKRTFYHHT